MKSLIQSHVISNNSAHDNDHSNVSWLLVSTSSINIFTASIDWYKYYLLCLNWDHYTCICISIWRPHLSTCDVWTHLNINTRRRRETWLLQNKVLILFWLIQQIFCGRWIQRRTQVVCVTHCYEIWSSVIFGDVKISLGRIRVMWGRSLFQFMLGEWWVHLDRSPVYQPT